MDNNKVIIAQILKEVKEGYSIGGMTSDQAKAIASQIEVDRESKKWMDATRKSLDKSWKEYSKGVEDTFAIATKEFVAEQSKETVSPLLYDKSLVDDVVAQQREYFKRGALNKGRELEFKVMLLTGNLENYNPVGNVPDYILGNMNVVIPEPFYELVDKELGTLSAQIKTEGATFRLAKGNKEATYIRRLNAELGKFGEDFAKQYAPYHIGGIRQRLALHEKNIVKVNAINSKAKNSLKSLETFFTAYFSLTAAQYLILGVDSGSYGSNVLVSIPITGGGKNSPEMAFIREFSKYFLLFQSNNDWQARWKGGVDDAFVRFIGANQKHGFHIHHLGGLKDFVKARQEGFGYIAGSKDQKLYNNHLAAHRSLLASQWNDFIIPHRTFLGGDNYNKPNY